MASALLERTNASLLRRVRLDATDQVAWSEFVRRYGAQVYRWCCKWQLQEADAQDLTQTVLVKLAVKMRTFTYDPARSFRAYLKTLTNYAWRDLLASRQRPDAAEGGSVVADVLQSAQAREDLVARLTEEFD
jgi:RNA polymerase sigma-70 factor (ECF subfamily)